MQGEERTAPREAILAHRISFLYELNLFGPEIVEALGRARVASAPAQRVIPLDDEGVLLWRQNPCRSGGKRFGRYSLATSKKATNRRWKANCASWSTGYELGSFPILPNDLGYILQYVQKGDHHDKEIAHSAGRSLGT